MKIFYGEVKGEIEEVQGLHGNLKVVGKVTENYKSDMLVTCCKCKDKELYATGVFRVSKGNLKGGSLPCGCAKAPKWEDWQWVVIVKRKLKGTSVNFIKLSSDFKGCYTKAVTYCELHDEINTTTSLIDLAKGYSGCKSCRYSKSGSKNSKSFKHFLKTGVESGALMEGACILSSTTFRKRKRLFYTCPVCSKDEYVENGLCDGVFNTTITNLLKGVKSCRCSVKPNWTAKQKEYQIKKKISCNSLPYTFIGFEGEYKGAKSKIRYVCDFHGEHLVPCNTFLDRDVGCPSCATYGYDSGKPANIYLVKWIGENDSVFCKVGITNNKVEDRVYQQRVASGCEVLSVKHFHSLSGKKIKAIESEIKSSFESGIVTKQVFPDGYTETFHMGDYPKILKLIETRINQKSQGDLNETIL